MQKHYNYEIIFGQIVLYVFFIFAVIPYTDLAGHNNK